MKDQINFISPLKIKKSRFYCEMSLSRMNKDMKQKCLKIVSSFIKDPLFELFVNRVKESEIPEYYDIIKEPMWLKEIQGKLQNQKYSKFSEFVYDMNLIWKNAVLFNGEESEVAQLALFMEYRFNLKLKNLAMSSQEKYLSTLTRLAEKINRYSQYLQNELDHVPTNNISNRD